MIRCCGSSVHCFLAGPADAPKVLFIHGFGFVVEMYAPIINRLIKQYRVLSIDLPGHGKTDALDNYGVDSFVDFLADAARQNGFTSFSIVGHSMGGLLALYCAQSAQFGQFQLDKVIAFCPAGIKIISSFN